MPTLIQTANEEPEAAFLTRELPAICIFLSIGLLQVVVAILTHGQWADFGEPALWIWP